MSIWSKWFGFGATKRSFLERDNKGTRFDSVDKSTTYWLARMSRGAQDPFVLFEFQRGGDAVLAFLELGCFHIASDTKNLICTEVLVFGLYRNESGKYEAMICGWDLNHDLWKKAKASFSTHHGVLKGEREPEESGRNTLRPNAPSNLEKVVFLREERTSGQTAQRVYRIHSAPDKATALAYLEKNPVNQRLLYVVIETPEGNYCRDIQGIYRE